MPDQTFVERYWATSLPAITEYDGHRCETCAAIKFSGFRSVSLAREMLNPAKVLLGSFTKVTKSAYFGCWTCRYILGVILPYATAIHETMLLNVIGEICLSLDLDDRLTLWCWDGEGRPFPLLGQERISIPLEDGAVDKYEEMDEEESSWNMTEYKSYEVPINGSLPLRMLLDCKENKFVPNPAIGKPDLAIFWRWNCISVHEGGCVDESYSQDDNDPSSEGPTLPTRVLDFACPGGPRVIETNGKRGRYVILSHCWGDVQHDFKLNRTNMPSLQASIDISRMPKTFAEAAMITIRMGIRYLWIDSMCIIQPTSGLDTEDWTREAPRMAEYYRHAEFTIAASAAVNSDYGCLFARPGSQFKNRRWPLFQEPITRKWDEFSTLMKRNTEWFPLMMPRRLSWLWQVQNCPLNKRAWVLQERLLSRRILHCTLQGLMWECPSMRATEVEPLGCEFDYEVRDEGLLQLSEAMKRGPDFVTRDYWHQVVERFSGLEISYQSDRLPALAGIAKLIQAKTGNGYVAGHWRESLPSSLLWFRIHGTPALPPPPSSQSSPPRPTGTVSRLPDAPSWAWSSTTAQVKFTSLYETDFPHRPVDGYQITAELVDLSTKPKTPLNPFGWLSLCRLSLRCRLKKYAPTSGNLADEGFPKMKSAERSSDEVWQDYYPMPEDSILKSKDITTIRMGAVSRPSTPDSESESEAVVEEMARLVADHDLLQARMKLEGMYVAKVASEKPKDWGKSEEEDSLECTFDIPSDAGDGRDLFLLEMLRETKTERRETVWHVSEGLVVETTRPDAAEYTRAGFFRLKARQCLFEDVEETVVLLV
ncbi:heterokaryon incompatibility protein-domain-containing protein [Plectosphaerella cucumerina]|uniref:Heterokaryon incompatibility protein-domain-containing protein n=1 Tax=Plectosphaerella cucumerina TaxID=40658 RepID=A0A8K0TDV1_9PEZI|nr:heterokaryon incompatibility protein-domain-containing protein [Plectosphaerella cucumerina]